MRKSLFYEISTWTYMCCRTLMVRQQNIVIYCNHEKLHELQRKSCRLSSNSVITAWDPKLSRSREWKCPDRTGFLESNGNVFEPLVPYHLRLTWSVYVGCRLAPCSETRTDDKGQVELFRTLGSFILLLVSAYHARSCLRSTNDVWNSFRQRHHHTWMLHPYHTRHVSQRGCRKRSHPKIQSSGSGWTRLAPRFWQADTRFDKSQRSWTRLRKLRWDVDVHLTLPAVSMIARRTPTDGMLIDSVITKTWRLLLELQSRYLIKIGWGMMLPQKGLRSDTRHCAIIVAD